MAATQDRASTYGGGQVSFNANVAKNNFQAGVYSFYQQNSEQFGAIFNDGSSAPFTFAGNPTGSLTAFFIDDKFKPFSWLTLTAGMRPTHFSGRIFGKRHQPALRRGSDRPASELDLPRFLRTLLPGAAAGYCFRAAAQFATPDDLRIYRPSWRARRRSISSE